jgi:DNA-binding HxlR family transcriptional regulator
MEPKTGCIAAAMAIIGNKWTALILRDLFEGPKRFCELERSVGTGSSAGTSDTSTSTNGITTGNSVGGTANISDPSSHTSTLNSTINPRTLSQRLDDLEAHGIITRTSYAEVPPRTEYALTSKGRDLHPILHQMATWGSKHNLSC